MGHKFMKSRCKSNLRALLDSTRLILEFRKVSVARLIFIFAGAIQHYKYYRLIPYWSKYHTGQNTALDNMPYSGQNTALGKIPHRTNYRARYKRYYDSKNCQTSTTMQTNLYILGLTMGKASS